MTGSVELWPVMADCERGLGRPERALAMAGEPEVNKLDKAGQVEMRLVAAGAKAHEFVRYTKGETAQQFARTAGYEVER